MLTKNVVCRTNAYEPNVDPMWSAGSSLYTISGVSLLHSNLCFIGDFDALCNSFDSLNHLLVDTGVGALPLSASNTPDTVALETPYGYPQVDETTMAKQVEETFAKVMSTKEAAEVAFNTLIHGTRQ